MENKKIENIINIFRSKLDSANNKKQKVFALSMIKFFHSAIDYILDIITMDEFKKIHNETYDNIVYNDNMKIVFLMNSLNFRNYLTSINKAEIEELKIKFEIEFINELI